MESVWLARGLGMTPATCSISPEADDAVTGLGDDLGPRIGLLVGLPGDVGGETHCRRSR